MWRLAGSTQLCVQSLMIRTRMLGGLCEMDCSCLRRHGIYCLPIWLPREATRSPALVVPGLEAWAERISRTVATNYNTLQTCRELQEIWLHSSGSGTYRKWDMTGYGRECPGLQDSNQNHSSDALIILSNWLRIWSNAWRPWPTESIHNNAAMSERINTSLTTWQSKAIDWIFPERETWSPQPLLNKPCLRERVVLHPMNKVNPDKDVPATGAFEVYYITDRQYAIYAPKYIRSYQGTMNRRANWYSKP